MGFDNECILNIQSLAGEYFCPVCRLLVYPNEALQSQCTHLYCKPCLTYVVSTTRACPYDGYLVTEADSKPLLESNKALAEIIGKIVVHCLYHRSGCTWQGPLSECTSHCSGCAFGNSPVVCNRCGIQIVHRQVQEHAQNCPGVQPQGQQSEVTTDTSSAGTATTADQTLTTQVAAVSAQSQTSQSTVTTTPGQDSSQQANSSSQTQAAVPTAEQWYQQQQQQQYQQYYQQYPGYDPYQQHYPSYHPYQQAAVPQYQQQHLQAQAQQVAGQHQPQVYMQPQPQSQLQPQQLVQPQSQNQPQSQVQPQPQPQPQAPQVQVSVPAQPQNQAQGNPQLQVLTMVPSQTQSQTYPPAHGHPNPQPQPYSQPQPPQHGQIPQYQQLHPQMQHPPQVQQQTQQPQILPQHNPPSQAQPQGQLQHPPQFHLPQPNRPPNANIQPQAQHPSAQAVTGHHSYPQPQPHPHQQMQAGTAQQYHVHAQPQFGPAPQSQNASHMQSHFPQQPLLMRPPHSHATIPSQQPALLPSPGQVQDITPSKQQSVHSHSQQPGHPVQQRPVMQPVQQPMAQPYYQQPQPYAQHQVAMTSQLRHPGQPHPFLHHTHVYPQPPPNVALSHGLQHVQSQNPVGRPLMPNQGVQSQPYPQSAGEVQARPVYVGGNQQSANQNNMLKANGQVQLPSEQHSGGNTRPIISERQGDPLFEKSLPLQETEVLPPKTGKIVANDVESAPGSEADVGEVKIEKSETDMKFKDNEHKSKVEDKTSQKKILQSTEMSIERESHHMENGEPKIRPVMEEVKHESTLTHSTNGKSGDVVGEDTKDVLDVETRQSEHSVLEKKEIMDGSQLKNPPLQVAKLHEEQGGKLQKDPISGSDESLKAASAASAPTVGCPAQNASSGGTVLGNEKIQSNQYGFLDKGGIGEPSHPLPMSDSGRPHYGSSTLPQRPGAPSLLQAPPPGPPHQSQGLGHPPTHFRPQGPGHVPGQPFHPPSGTQERGFTATFGRGPGQYGPAHRSFDVQSGAPPGTYNQGHVPALPFGAVPPSAFDSHGGVMARAIPHGPEGRMSLQHPPDALEPEMFPNQGPDHMNGRRRDPFIPGSLEQGSLAQPSSIHQNLMRMNGTPGFDSSSTLGSRDERFKPLLDERLNSMPLPPGPDRRGFDHAEFEDDLKQFPVLDAEPIPKFRNISSRPYDRGPPEGKYDAGLKLDPGTGSTSSRFLSPYHRGGALQANEVGERPVGLHEDIIRRAEPNHGHPDFFGPVPAYGRHHMDSLPPQSPSREYPGISSRGFGGSGYDDFDGRELHRFGEPVGNAFHEGRFTMLPGHLRRGEFEVPGNMRMGEHFRSDFIGQDNLPSHLRRGEHLGPHNLHGHLHFGEPVGFGGHPRHAQIGGMAGPGSFESFAGGNRPSYPRLGEPGFRSSFSLQGFPNDGGSYTGDMEFHNWRKRKPASSGWCRICKVDCETVEGLDLHSQTREHQKLSMDMVLSIKQTAKKQKLTSGDHSSLGDASKSRNAGAEGRAKNN
ncbi:hypothetical protein FEM48_Zijuj02G0062000 [Ziziphus jujuba var. spinosa]|uniref:RING-type domain-containing protein n=1 Tax=Ziziphus jujuba var. spinosa TaxID=714518 RepID=A0A978VU34_ZIZJJ|nr:AT-rich interactive domain-containing protein 1A-like [Ziziphus jujuba var. spinosa]KAH7542329.1 hypothetical protein FEM48_Zijuj02G0062000 [Ziziphus jujuba var. spinosa]